MERIKEITIQYKDEDINVSIDKTSREIASVTIYKYTATGRIEYLTLTRNEALQLVTLLYTANEEGDI